MKPFREIASNKELAALLDVPIGALYVVELLDGTTCTTEGCYYPAVRRNTVRREKGGHKCVVHHQGWFPKPDVNNCRGHGLLGLQFLRDEEKGSKKSCCCSNKYCLEIGYSSSNKTVPQGNLPLRKKIANALRNSLSPEAKKRILDPKQRNLWIAPWHFFPEVRTKDPQTNEWSLKHIGPTDTFKDDENVVWTGFPPPNYCPKRFIDEEISTPYVEGAEKTVDF